MLNKKIIKNKQLQALYCKQKYTTAPSSMKFTNIITCSECRCHGDN